MKRILLAIFAAALTVAAYAQSSVTTTWPYLYGDFTQGQITSTTGPQEPCLLNVHLAQGRIHYIDKQNNVREVNTKNFVKAEIAGSEFVIKDGMLLKVLVSNDAGLVAASYLADFSSLNETGGAYGVSSSTLSTQKLSSVESNSVNMNHMELMSHKTEGQPLEIKTTNYIVFGGKCIEATKKDVAEAVPADKQNAFKSFLKTNKINWKSASDLEAVLNFLAE